MLQVTNSGQETGLKVLLTERFDKAFNVFTEELTVVLNELLKEIDLEKEGIIKRKL